MNFIKVIGCVLTLTTSNNVCAKDENFKCIRRPINKYVGNVISLITNTLTNEID